MSDDVQPSLSPITLRLPVFLRDRRLTVALKALEEQRKTEERQRVSEQNEREKRCDVLLSRHQHR
jgi:hypothetical protein